MNIIHVKEEKYKGKMYNYQIIFCEIQKDFLCRNTYGRAIERKKAPQFSCGALKYICMASKESYLQKTIGQGLFQAIPTLYPLRRKGCSFHSFSR